MMDRADQKAQLDGDYQYVGAGNWGNDYLVNPLVEIITGLGLEDKRLFEIGFGNGWTANYLAEKGYDVTGIEPSDSGVAIAQKAFPSLNLYSGNVYHDLKQKYGTFPVIYSLEVIEHCQFPRKFAKTAFDLLQPSGTAIISTPYHGYLKSLVIALLGKTDSHYNPLWDDGHIRFFSEKTLTILFLEAGFTSIKFIRAGRISPLSKSTIAVLTK